VWLIYRGGATFDDRDIYGIRPGLDSVPIPLVTGPFPEDGPALSPDRKWLAYTSVEPGQPEIFVRPFPGTSGGRWQVSARGGSAAVWARNGRELFFESLEGDIMTVPINASTSFSFGEPRRLVPGTDEGLRSLVVPYYDVTPDSHGFIMVRAAALDEASGAGRIVFVENWLSELEQKMAAARPSRRHRATSPPRSPTAIASSGRSVPAAWRPSTSPRTCGTTARSRSRCCAPSSPP
jgi:serine/threonine-protein kinase